MKKLVPALALLTLLQLGAAPTFAQERDRDRGRDHERAGREPNHDNRGPVWRGEVSRFHEHDVNIWRGGRWQRSRHEGRLGWWWVVGGLWYFYPQPVYPYPDPYLPPDAVTPPTQYWYYCNNPSGYYPYVPRCLVPWQAVPATVPPG